MKIFPSFFYRKSLLRAGAALTALLMMGMIGSTAVRAEIVGEVSTTFKLIGANDKIVIEAFDDPDISGATCYLSRAKTGGIKGTVGLAEDTSDASIACRQTGPIVLPEDVANGKNDGDQVFRKSTSLLFKKLQVVRFYDPKRNTLIYLTYSEKLIDGSPKNSIYHRDQALGEEIKVCSYGAEPLGWASLHLEGRAFASGLFFSCWKKEYVAFLQRGGYKKLY
ncbi:MAG: hypothetical protein D3908_09355 [Candidatus Electrothrix sp. AUS4]|nr:hypothetical protein [Candidatus Electrothrix sp. AUS4]